MTNRFFAAVSSLFIASYAGCALDRYDGPPYGASLHIEAPQHSGVADGQTPLCFAVLLADGIGRPIPQASLRITTDDALARPTEPRPTDALGTTQSCVTTSKPGLIRVNAEHLTGPASSKAETFIVLTFLTPQSDGAPTQDPNLATLALTSEHTVAAADSRVPVVLNLSMRSHQDQPLAGVVVTFQADRAADSLSPTEGVTDENGLLTVLLSTSQLGSATVTARGAGTSTQYTVNFVSGPPHAATSLLVARQQGAIANGQDKLTVDLLLNDDAGRGVPYAAASFLSSNASDRVVSADTRTDARGIASIALASTQAGDRTLTANFSTGEATTTGFLLPGPPVSMASMFTAWGDDGVADGATPALLRAALIDAFGNPVTHRAISLISDTPGDIFEGDTVQTDGLGTLMTTMVGTVAGSRNVSLICDGVVFQTPLRFEPGTASPSTSRLTVSAPVLTVGIPGSVQLTVTDAYGNPRANERIYFSSSQADDSLSLSTGLTDNMGLLNLTLTGTTARSRTLVASLGSSGASVNQRVTLAAGTPDRARSLLTLTPDIAPIDAVAPVTVTLVAKDAYGNAVPNARVDVTATGTGNTFGQTSGVTDASGQFVTTLRSDVAEAKQVGCTVGAIALDAATVTFSAGAPSQSHSELSVTGTSAAADGNASLGVDVVLRDSKGNLVPHQPVVLRAAGHGIILRPSSGMTAADGHFRASASSVEAGTRQIVGTALGVALAANATFTSGPPDGNRSLLRSSVGTLVADGAAATTLSLQAIDAYGNAVPGAWVTWSSPQAGATFQPISVVTDASGMARASLTSVQTGTTQILATFNTGAVVKTTVAFLAGPATAAQSTLVLSPSTQIADASPVSAVFTLKDGQGHPIANESVLFTAAGAPVQISPGRATTNLLGEARVMLASTVAQDVNITASGDSVTASGHIQFVAGAPVASQSLILVDAASVVADGVSALLVEGQLRDAYLNPVSGYLVALGASAPASQVVPAGGATDANGVFLASWSSTTAGQQNIVMSAGPVVLTGHGLFGAGAPDGSSSVLIASPNAQVANGSATVAATVTLKDGFGNAVPGVTVVFGDSGTSGSLDGNTAVTDANGGATILWRSRRAGLESLPVTVGGTVLTTAVQWLPGLPTAAQSSFVAASAGMADGATSATVVLDLKDRHGNAVPNAFVTFSAPAPYVVVPASTTTDASGHATAAVYGSLAGTPDIAATTSADTLHTTATFLPGSPNVAASLFWINPTVLVADGNPSGTAFVSVTDDFGNPVAGLPVSVVSSDSSDVLSGPSFLDAKGSASFALSTLTPGTKLLTVDTPLGGALSASYTAVPVGTAVNLVTLSTSPNVIIADGLQVTTLNVYGVDTNGTPLAGETVHLSIMPPSASLGATDVPLDGAGQGSTTLLCHVAGDVTVSATVAGVTTTQRLLAHAGAPDPSQSTLTVTPSRAPADGVHQLSLTATFKDRAGNPVTDAVVSASMDGSAVLVPRRATTDGLGQWTSTATSTTAASNTATVTVGSATLTQASPFFAGAADSSHTVLLVEPQPLVADGSQAANVRLLLADAYGNAIGNAAVALSAPTAGIDVDSLQGTTDASGQWLTRIRSTQAGTATLQVLAENGAYSAPVTFLAGSPNQARTGLDVVPEAVPADGASTATVRLHLADAFGNAVAHAPVAWSMAVAGATLLPTTTTTDANGYATATVTGTLAQVASVAAQVGPVTVSTDVVLMAGPPSVAASSLSAMPAAAAANGSDSITLTVLAKDAHGNVVPHQKVAVSTTQAAVSALGPATTDGNGLWVGSLSSTEAGTTTVTVSLGLVTLTQRVHFEPGPAAMGHSTIALSAPSALANGDSYVNATVYVADAYDNAIEGQPVVMNFSGSANLPTTCSGISDAEGLFGCRVSSTFAQDKDIVAQVAGFEISATAHFVAGLPSSSTSTLTAAPDPVTADGVAASLITVIARDADSNPIAGQLVNLQALPPNVSCSPSSGITDASGTWSTSITSTQAGHPRILADLGTASVATTLTFTAGAPYGPASTLWASAQNVVADNNSRLDLTFFAADKFGNAVAAAPVHFFSSRPGVTFSPEDVTTDDLGLTTSSVRVTDVGAHTLYAAVGGMNVALGVNALPGSPSARASQVLVSGVAPIADGYSSGQVSVLVQDAFGHPLANAAVSLSASGSANSWSAPSGATDANGLYLSYLSSTTAETKVITASLGSSTVTGNIVFVAGPMHPASSSLMAAPNPFVADGSAASVLYLAAKDAHGNTVSGHGVTLAATGSATTFSPGGGVTDSLGQWQGQVRTAQAQNQLILARADETSVNTRVASLRTGSTQPTLSLTTASQTVTADGTQTVLTVQVTDSLGLPMGSQRVLVQVSGSHNTLSQNSGMTAANGSFNVSLSSTVAETKWISATAAGITTVTPVTFTAGAPNAARSSITVAAVQPSSDGDGGSTLYAVVRDIFGNPVASATGNWSVSGLGSSIAPTSGTSDETGLLAARVTSTVAEQVTVTLGIGGVMLAAPVQFGPGREDQATSLLTASPDSIAANGAASSSVVLALRDAQNNPVAGETVTFSVADDAGMAMPQTTTTDATGRATTHVSATVAAHSRIVARTANLNLSVPVTFIPGPPSNSHSTLVIAPDAIVADGHSNATVAVIVRDAFDNVVPDSPVKVSASVTGASVVGGLGSSDEEGQFVAFLTATRAQLIPVSVALAGTSLYAEIRAIPGPPSSVTSSITSTPSQSTADGNSSIGMLVAVKDAFGNAITQKETTLTVSGMFNDLDVDAPATDDNGHLMAQLRTTKAQPKKVTAVIGGTTLDANVLFVPGAPTNQTVSLSIDPHYATAGSVAPIAVSFVAYDALGNPVPDQPVTFSSDFVTDAFFAPTATTDADGQATVFVQATQAGMHVLRASLADVFAEAPLTVVADRASASTTTAILSPNEVVADGSSRGTLVVVTKDLYGNLAANEPVTLALGAGQAAATNLSPPMGYTSVDGVFISSVTSTVAEAKTVTVEVSGMVVNAFVTFVPGPVSPLTSSVTATPPAATADGVGPIVVTVTLRDAHNNAVFAEPVDLGASGSSNVFDATSGITDSLGTWSTALRSTAAEVKDLTVTTRITALLGSATFTPGSPNATYTTLQPTPSSLVADGTSLTTLTLRVRDAFGNPVPDAPITWSVLPQTTLSQATAYTGPDGSAMAQAASTLAQMQNVWASMPDATVFASVSWTPGAAALARSSWVVDTPTLVANDVDTASFVLTLADVFNNAISGQSVAPVPLGSGYTYSPENGVTDANGQWVTHLRGTQAGAVSATLATGGLNFSNALTFLAGPADSTKSVFSASPHTAVADGNPAIELSGTFVDAYNNAIAHQPYTLAAGSHTTLMPADGLTSNTGTVQGTASSLTVMADTVTITLGSVTFDTNVLFTTGPASAVTSSLVVNPNANIASDGNAAAQMLLTVRDAQFRALPGLPINFMRSNADCSLSNITATTDSAGMGSTYVTSKTAGIKALRAQVGSLSFGTTASFSSRPPLCPNNVVLGVRPTYLPLSGFATKMRTVDMDGDGKPDLLISGTYSPVVNVFYNNGNGSFASAVKLGTADHAQDFVTVDLNGDSRTDIVAVNNANYLLTFKGISPRTFTTATLYGLNGNFSAICSADINKDGKPDIVAISNANKPGFGIFIGDGSGSYSSATFYPTTGTPTSCVAQDLNKDGYIDLAITNNTTNAVDIYPGNAAGTYGSKTSYSVGSSPNTIVAGLFNSDSFVDLAVTNGNISVGTISVLLADGLGGYLPQVTYPTDRSLNDLKLYDVDGDGNLDLVAAAGYTDRTRKNEAMPSGFFGNAVNILLGRPDGSFSALNRIAAGGSIQTASVADFNGDGLVDLAYGMTLTTTAGIAFGAGNMNFQTVTQYHTPLASGRVIPKDLNHDGVIDLVTASLGDQTGAVFMGSTPGFFNPPQALSALSYNHGFGLADLNGDGNVDYIGVEDNGPGISVGLGVGDGTFVASNAPLLPIKLSVYPSFTVMTKDLNGDGRADVVLVDENLSRIYILTSVGNNGGFSIGQVPYPSGQNTCRNAGALVDINNDGYIDIVLPCQQLFVLMGSPAGDYTQSYAFTSSASNFRSLTAIDINRDGFIDIAAETSWEFVIFTNNKDGTFAARPKVSFLSSGEGNISTGDINGDGYLDLVKTNTKSLSVFFGTAGGGLGSEIAYPAGLIQFATTYDIDQDGRDDILAAVLDEGLVIYPSKGCSP